MPPAARTLVATLLALCAMSCASKKNARAIAPSIGTRQTGIASWYGDPYHGRATASGEVYDMERDTAAHRRYAFGTWVRVDNLDNGKRTEVRINDRGPFVRGRIIDLSRSAARDIDMLGPGTAKVRLTVVAPPRNTRTPPARATAAPLAGEPSMPPQPAPDLPRVPALRPPLAAQPSMPSQQKARWGVQVASFRDRTLAEKLAARIQSQGRVATLHENGEWTRVVVSGREQSETEARDLLQTLRTDYPSSVLFSTAYPLPGGGSPSENTPSPGGIAIDPK